MDKIEKEKKDEENNINNINIDSNNKKETSEIHVEKYKKKSEYPNFLLKLYQILENKEYKEIIEWSEDGKYFIIKNLHDFTENILPKYYKHNNYSSFIRQLNMYDFHKRKGNPNEHIFEHKNFIKDRKDLLKLIKRKSKKEPNINNNINNIYDNNNKIIYYPNFYINNTNGYYPLHKKELLPYYPNQPFINNDKKISSFSLDDNITINNNSEKNNYLPYKKIPLLPMSQSQNNINIQPNEKEEKVTKKNLQNLLSYLMHSVDENTETQKQLEQKIERLSNQNEEFISQNKKILQEIVTNNDYNKRLEGVICFILEMIMTKPKMKNNQELKNLFIANEPNINTKNIFNNNSGSILEPYQTFLNKYMERTKNGEITKFNNNNNILLDEEKNLLPYSNNNTENLKRNLIGNGDEDINNNNYPIVLSKKRKRSSSFNSILSNISKGSNIYFNNNNKLLNSEEEKEKKEENSITIKRKDSLSSWNDNNKNIFDLDINQEENKSIDLLNNSQTSFNDIYGNNNPNNTFSDINN